MPHAAIIIGAALAAGGAAFLLNELVVQPALQRRREEQEAQEEMDRAIAMSLYEYDRDQLERKQQEERDVRAACAASSTYTSTTATTTTPTPTTTTGAAPSWHSAARIDPFSDRNAVSDDGRAVRSGVVKDDPHYPSSAASVVSGDSQLRRRKQFESQSEMHERPRDMLFDAGPISRFDTSNAFSNLSATPAGRTAAAPAAAALRTDSPLCLPAADRSAGPPAQLLDDTASLSEKELESFLSPSDSPSSSTPASIKSRPDLNKESMTASRPSSVAGFTVLGPLPIASVANSRAGSPTPTVRSTSAPESLGVLASRPHSPPYQTSEIEVEYVENQDLGPSCTPSRGSSPFSVIEDYPSTSQTEHQLREEVYQSSRSEAGDSAWSDLGEDSSDEELVQLPQGPTAPPHQQNSFVRHQRQTYFGGFAGAH